MTILIGIGIGVFICYYLRVSAQTRQEMVIKQAQNDLLLQLAAKAQQLNEGN